MPATSKIKTQRSFEFIGEIIDADSLINMMCFQELPVRVKLFEEG